MQIRGNASYRRFLWYTNRDGMTIDQHSAKPPGELLRELLKERSWTQDDLSLITGRSIKAINDLVRGHSGVTPEMAACLAAAFGNTSELWMQADTMYRLSLVSGDTSQIEKRARLFSLAPIRDMQRRGWIRETSDIGELETELASFFADPYTSERPAINTRPFFVAARRTDNVPNLTPAETAWCFRARQLASTSPIGPFARDKASRAKAALRQLAAHPKEARHLSAVLAEYGIRFVVVEPLPGVRIDGAAFLDDIGPVMAISLRHDRVDGFWFTVMHEFSHIRHGDAISVDSGMVDAVTGVVAVQLAGNEVEDRANSEASASLVATREMESFISRVGPLYPRQRIIQFANRIRIHPGIIVGQLQHRGEIGYASMRDQLVKIREHVVSTALTDGWGQTISPTVARR